MTMLVAIAVIALLDCTIAVAIMPIKKPDPRLAVTRRNQDCNTGPPALCSSRLKPCSPYRKRTTAEIAAIIPCSGVIQDLSARGPAPRALGAAPASSAAPPAEMRGRAPAPLARWRLRLPAA